MFVCAIEVNQCIGAYQAWWCLCAIGVGSYQVRAVAGGSVRHHGGRLAGQGGRGTAAGVDPLLLLPAVAEPHADHLLLHVELLGDQQDLL